MHYYVYMLRNTNSEYKKTYVGYTVNLKERLKKHNNNKGAKSTKGYNWEIIYKKKFFSKSKAMSFEYKLKKDRSKRLIIIQKANAKKI